MFSASDKEEDVFTEAASQQAQVQELENCETVSHFIARRMGARSYCANPEIQPWMDTD
jgi:hypothetical protein